VKDVYGIPVLKIHMSDGENERAMIQDMGDSAGEMLEAAGAKDIRAYAHPSAPRWALHEAGIARMGSDPKNLSSINFSRPTTLRIFSSWTLPASLRILARTPL